MAPRRPRTTRPSPTRSRASKPSPSSRRPGTPSAPEALFQRALEAQDAAQDRERRGVGGVHPVVAQAPRAGGPGLGEGLAEGEWVDPEADGELGEVTGSPTGMAAGS